MYICATYIYYIFNIICHIMRTTYNIPWYIHDTCTHSMWYIHVLYTCIECTCMVHHTFYDPFNLQYQNKNKSCQVVTPTIAPPDPFVALRIQ